MSAVVSDSSPLNYLALLSDFDLLRQIYHTVVIPPAARGSSPEKLKGEREVSRKNHSVQAVPVRPSLYAPVRPVRPVRLYAPVPVRSLYAPGFQPLAAGFVGYSRLTLQSGAPKSLKAGQKVPEVLRDVCRLAGVYDFVVRE